MSLVSSIATRTAPLVLMALACLSTASAEEISCSFATRHADNFSLEYRLSGSGAQRTLELTVRSGSDVAIRELKGHFDTRQSTFFSESIEGIWLSIGEIRGSETITQFNILEKSEILSLFEGFARSVDKLTMPDNLISGFPLDRHRQEYRGEILETITARRNTALDFKIGLVVDKASGAKTLSEIGIHNRNCDVKP